MVESELVIEAFKPAQHGHHATPRSTRSAIVEDHWEPTTNIIRSIGGQVRIPSGSYFKKGTRIHRRLRDAN
jgi:hypothetical protein